MIALHTSHSRVKREASQSPTGFMSNLPEKVEFSQALTGQPIKSEMDEDCPAVREWLAKGKPKCPNGVRHPPPRDGHCANPRTKKSSNSKKNFCPECGGYHNLAGGCKVAVCYRCGYKHMKKAACRPQPAPARPSPGGNPGYVAPTSAPPPISPAPSGSSAVPVTGGRFSENLARLMELELTAEKIAVIYGAMRRSRPSRPGRPTPESPNAHSQSPDGFDDCLNLR
ncbi:hypothetical protein AOQ84DRAFT_226062 [Glonium stellatum]|uniref:Uncharacterized protein n=1 Tax=Glonium stellatum TaxID=574774 RepID=A0A8E2FAF0_9PEZI|nr:hypothetical protein AOQ84DRAFT_226062 [Glonium stellatum]